jgi:hypothetical protein
MSTINQNVEKLHQQFQIRTSGENGVAKGLIDMSNPIESWLVLACATQPRSQALCSDELDETTWV